MITIANQYLYASLFVPNTNQAPNLHCEAYAKSRHVQAPFWSVYPSLTMPMLLIYRKLNNQGLKMMEASTESIFQKLN